MERTASSVIGQFISVSRADVEQGIVFAEDNLLQAGDPAEKQRKTFELLEGVVVSLGGPSFQISVGYNRLAACIPEKESGVRQVMTRLGRSQGLVNE